jgi:hypothetical protein
MASRRRDMESLENTAARLLYAIATEAGCANAEGNKASPLEYDKQLDAFIFPDGRFAFDRKQADPGLVKALGLAK